MTKLSFMHQKSLYYFLLIAVVVKVVAMPAAAASRTTFSFEEGADNQYVFDTNNLELSPAGTIQFTDIQEAWYGDTWDYRQKLTIDHTKVHGELTDFPVLVSITAQGNDIFDRAQADGDDILFTTYDGTTKLSHEIEEFVTTGDNKRLIAWVKLPTLTDITDTTLYLYYGNSTADTQQDAENVWEGSFKGVWHLDDAAANDVADGYEDSTANDKHGIAKNFNNSSTSSTNSTGKVGTAVQFDGADDYIFVEDYNWPASKESVTVSMWAKVDADTPGNSTLFSVDNGVRDDTDRFALSPWTSNNFLWNYGHLLGQVVAGANSFDPYYDNWVHITAVAEGDVGTFRAIYINGVPIKTLDTGVNGPDKVLADLNIGRGMLVNFHYTLGQIDEFRIANRVRSASYIKTEYNNQANPTTFFKTDNTSNFTQERIAHITPSSDQAIAYTSLNRFTEVATLNGGAIRYQLSNDAGVTWYWYDEGLKRWMPTTDRGFLDATEASIVNANLASFPKRDAPLVSQLLWRAYLKSDGRQDVSLTTIHIDYTSTVASPTTAKATGNALSLPTSLSDPRIQAINSLFRSAYATPITPTAWTYWVTRMMTEVKPLDAWLGAMQWQALYGN